MSQALSPKHFAVAIAEDDADIGPESFLINHEFYSKAEPALIFPQPSPFGNFIPTETGYNRSFFFAGADNP
ncbi:hypothetical protein [Thiothrix sp.]|uniref:hypothetical protein n=1 Tax=Thiothrix sp. TaxID=1032 RepID=UPI002609C974|nr:hypothetical protein [Thiothrix sp.]